jgi:hypothetical protein
MQNRLIALAATLCLVSPLFIAAASDCATEETTAALAKHDNDVAARESNIAEMRDEIAQGGGSTDDQKKVLKSFEDKLAQMKQKRVELVEACAGRAAP